MENIGEKIVDYLNLLTSADVNSVGSSLDLRKYPSLTSEDVYGHWKSWTFKLQKLFLIYFGREPYTSVEYEDAPFHDRTIMYLSQTIFENVEEEEYPCEKFLEDVSETIHHIQKKN